mmetsp:Transcript_23633/g.33894  ORF Transcript_23633/g.33894 Transcript_23633/m.33894 type:complete len:173 (+) Transcript_23633:86-604(+)
MMDFNCSTDSMLLYSNTNSSWANDKMVMEMQQKCINDINNKTQHVCSYSNSSNTTEIHWNLIFTWPTFEVDELTKSMEKKCEKVVGTVIKPSFQIGFSGFKYTDYATLHGMELFQIDQAQFLDIPVNGGPKCIALASCQNSTDIVEFVKANWAAYYGLDVYNFTMYDIGMNS